MPELNATPDLIAARLAILAMRSTIAQSSPLDADHVRFGSDPTVLSTDGAAQLLASLPKPLVCDAEAGDGMLIVQSWPLSESDPNEQQLHESRQRADEKRGSIVPYVEEHYGPGDHLIAAVGSGTWLLVPHSVVKQWRREYEIRGINCVGDDVANPLLLDHIDYVEARQRGAKGVLRFLAWGSSGEEFFSTITLYSEGGLDQLPKETQGNLVEMARASRRLLQMIIAEASLDEPAPPRSSWAAWRRMALGAQRTRLTGTAAMMRTVCKGGSMPPDVAAFVEECEKYFGPEQ